MQPRPRSPKYCPVQCASPDSSFSTRSAHACRKPQPRSQGGSEPESTFRGGRPLAYQAKVHPQARRLYDGGATLDDPGFQLKAERPIAGNHDAPAADACRCQPQRVRENPRELHSLARPVHSQKGRGTCPPGTPAMPSRTAACSSPPPQSGAYQGKAAMDAQCPAPRGQAKSERATGGSSGGTCARGPS